MDKYFSGGSITVELAAGIIKFPNSNIPLIKTVKASVEIKDQDDEQVACVDSFLPALSSPVITVELAAAGILKFPNINIPLVKTVKASLEIKDQDDEQVACVDSSLPALSCPVSALETIPFSSCDDETKSRTKNFHMETNPPEPVKGDTINIIAGGDLDEDFSSGNFHRKWICHSSS